MDVIIKRFTLILLLSFPLTLHAESLPELLIPVEYRTAEDIAEKNKAFLSERLYFARRHKIVEINFSLLQQKKSEFTITPFDTGVRVKTERIDRKPRQQFAFWHGSIVNDKLKDLDNMPLSKELKKVIKHSNRVKLMISAHATKTRPYSELRTVTGERISSQQSRKEGFGISPNTVSHPGVLRPGSSATTNTIDQVPVETLMGTLNFLQAGRYEILALENDPRYHVVYEVDHSKTVVDGAADSDERRQNYHRHLNNLKGNAKKAKESGDEIN